MNVQVDPNEDTEWNDILRKHGIIPEKPPSPTPIIEEALTQARQLAHENRLEGKDLDELDELEDDEDESFLDSYRQKRMAELASATSAAVYNQVYPLQKAEYPREVTEESGKAFVLVLLTSSQGMNVESRVMVDIWRELSAKFGDLKFCQMRADLCIDGYPDKNTPTVLVYRDGDIRRQIVTLRELKGPQTKAKDFEPVLVQLGAVKHGDTRLSREHEESQESRKTIQSGKTMISNNDDDSDWE